jgi:hypothetical protein
MSDVLPYIDHYFNGGLSTEDKKTFEERCLADPAFAHMVAFYISLQGHLHQQWTERKKQQFAQLETETFSADETSISKNGMLKASEYNGKEDETRDINTIEERNKRGSLKEVLFVRSSQEERWKKEKAKKRPITRWKWLAVAASFLVIIVTGITLYVLNTKQGTIVTINTNQGKNTKSKPATNNSSTQNNVVVDSVVKQTNKKNETPAKGLDKAEQQQLFAQNFVPDALPGQENELLKVAFEQYKKGNYKQASTEYEEVQKVVESLTTRSPEDEQEENERKQILFYAHYYNALSYLASGNTTKAIRELETIKESPDRYWQCKQHWYFALAYIKTGEVAKAAALLQQVANSKQAGEYKQKAIDLRKALQEE